MLGGKILVADVQRAVAREFDLPVSVMSEPSGVPGAQTAEHARPRQLAMSLSLILTRHSLVRVGQFFGNRDHSTVISARKSVDRRLRTDAKFKASARNVLRELREASHG